MPFGHEKSGKVKSAKCKEICYTEMVYIFSALYTLHSALFRRWFYGKSFRSHYAAQGHWTD